MNTQPLKPTLHARSAGRWRSRIGCAVLILGALFLIGVIIFIFGRHLWFSEPTYWTDNRVFTSQTDEAVLTETADRAFNRVLSELSNSNGYQPSDLAPDAIGVRTIRLSFEEANAWLATRLGDWLVNQKRELPVGVSEPMLSSDGDELVAAFRYKHEQVDQVFSVLLSMRFLDNGQATLHVDAIYGGRLRLPTQTVLDQLPVGNGKNDNKSRIIAVLLGQQAFDPVLPIDGTRQGRIIGMEVDERSVSLTVAAEPVK